MTTHPQQPLSPIASENRIPEGIVTGNPSVDLVVSGVSERVQELTPEEQVAQQVATTIGYYRHWLMQRLGLENKKDPLVLFSQMSDGMEQLRQRNQSKNNIIVPPGNPWTSIEHKKAA